jgi:hypothetical protein
VDKIPAVFKDSIVEVSTVGTEVASLYELALAAGIKAILTSSIAINTIVVPNLLFVLIYPTPLYFLPEKQDK